MNKFIDKSSAGNLTCGLEFYAAGLVRERVTGAEGQEKEYVVEFIDPSGMFNRQWRSADEIIVSEIDENDFDLLSYTYGEAES